MQEITPLMWFDDKAEEAVNFCPIIFRNSRGLSFTRYEEEASKAPENPKGSVKDESHARSDLKERTKGGFI